MVKNLPANAGPEGDVGSTHESGRSPRGGNDNPLKYSCLENPGNGQRSLAGYSLWGCKKLNVTENALVAKSSFIFIL